MGNSGDVRYREPDSRCTMCVFWTYAEPRPAVDEGGFSPHEVDGLCTPHRAKATEGVCILCGLGLPWLFMKPGSTLGVCRAGFGEGQGEEAARGLTVYWEALDMSIGFWPAQLRIRLEYPA